MGRLILDNITVRYGERVVLEGVTLSFHIPGFIAIVGPNGAGKSTLAKVITQTIPFEGDVRSEDVSHTLKVGYVWQNPDLNFISSRVWEEVIISLLLAGNDRETAEEKAEVLLKEFGLWRFRQSDINSLSGGYKQVLAIITMVSMDPDLIIFDEVTSMLDVKERYIVLGYLYQLSRRMLIFLITQREEELKYVSRVIGIAGGKVVYDGDNTSLWDGKYQKLGLSVPKTYMLTKKWGLPWKPLGMLG